MKIYEVLADAAAREGIERVFGVMGDANKLWMARLASTRPAIPVHYARHESAAVAMADGFARATGKLGVASTTAGPGLAFTATSLLTAKRHGSPVLVYAGDIALGDRGGLQYLDQRRFVESLEVEHRALLRPDHVSEDFAAACALARSRRTPVVLTVPADLQERETRWELDHEPVPAAVTQAPHLRPDPAVLADLVERLVKAERPLILAGRGSFGQGTREALEELAGLLAAPLSTTLLAKGLFHGSQWDLGVAGLFSSVKGQEIFAAADVVLALGAGLNNYTTEGGALFPSATVIQVDTRSYSPRDGFFVPHHYVQADACAVATEIVRVLRERRHAARPDQREVLAAVASAREDGLPDAAGGLAPDGKLDQSQVMRVVAPTLDGDDTVVIGMGHFWWFPIRYLPLRAGRTFFTHDFGSIGQALPVGIGAALGGRERVVVIEGDASILMCLQELDTAARYGARVLVLAMNDEGVGAEYHRLLSKGERPDDAIIPSPDLAAAATAFGALGMRATTLEELDGALKKAATHDGPALIDVRVSREPLAEPYRRLWYPHGAEAKH
jgi:acetolactate synthase-1/2/3 large subunit